MFFFFLSCLISAVGAIAGIGGGMILKPILESTTELNLLSINLLSTLAVLAMTISALWQQRNTFRTLSKTLILWVIVGSLVGGYLGQFIFAQAWQSFSSEKLRLIQDGMLFIIVCLIIVFEKKKHRYKRSEKAYNGALKSASIGALLGGLASFLGIGGGPFNKPILEYKFNLTNTYAALVSLVIIFFSQTMSLASFLARENLDKIEWACAPSLILGALLGGALGGWLLHRLGHRWHDKIFLWTLYFIAVLNLYNIFHVFL